MAINTQEFKIKLSVVDGASKPIKDVAVKAEESSGALSKLGINIIALNQALEIGKKAFEMFVEPVKDAVKAYIAYEQASNKVATSLKLTGQYTQQHVKDFQDFAQELQETSNVADDMTLQLVSMAKASGYSDQQTKNLITTSANLSTLMDKDMKGAFQELIGQYSGIPGRLQKIIPELGNFTQAQLRAGKGLEYLSARLKGLAEEDAKSLGGAIEGVKLAFEDFSKGVGRTISETVNLPAVVAAVRSALTFLNHEFELIGPKIVAVGNALRQVDWVKVAQGVALATASFIALRQAMALSAAIQAIGGISSAVAAMGGVSGMIKQTIFYFKALAVAGWEAVAPLLVMAGYVVAAVAAFALIEVVIRNLDKMDQLLAIAKESAMILGEAFKLAFQGVIYGVVQANSAIFGFINKVTGLYGDTAKDASASADKIGLSMANTFDSMGQHVENIKKESEGLDFGATGEAVKFVSGLVKDLTADTKEAGKGQKDYADKAKGAIPPLQEQLKLLAEIKDQNLGMSNDIANIGVSQSVQIQHNLDLELQRLDVKQKQLELEGKLAGEQGENIKAALAAQRGLLKDKAAKTTDQIKNPNAVGADNIEAIKGAMGDGAGAIADTIGSAVGGISGAMTGVGAVMGAVTGVLDFVQQVIDFIPQVLSKVAGIFNSLTDLPNKIASGIGDVMKGIVNFITNFIPNLLNAIPTILNTLIKALFEEIPNAIIGLIQALPDIIIGILDQLPDIIEHIITGLITNAPRMAIALTEGIIRGVPRIAIALVKIFYIEIPKAIIKGIIEGGKQLVQMIQDVLSGKGIKLPQSITDLPKNIEKAASNLGKSMAKEASQIFAVKDLTDGLKGLNNITDPAMISADTIDKKFRNLWQMLKDAWLWVYNKIIKPIIDGIKAVWSWVYDNVIAPIADIVKNCWEFVYSTFIEPIADIVKNSWSFVYDNFMAPFIEWLTDAWNTINDNVIMPMIDGLKNVWQTIWNSFIAPIGGVISAAWTTVYNFFNTIFQGKINEAFRGVITDLQNVGTKIWAQIQAGIQGGLDVFRQAGSMIWDGLRNGLGAAGSMFSSFGTMIWDSLRNGLGNLGGHIMDQLNAINPANLMQKMFKFDGGGTGPVEKVLGIDVPYVSFAQGGYVPGQARVPGDSLVNDRIIAMVSPGEAILPRSITKDPALKPYVDALMTGNPKNLPAFYSWDDNPVTNTVNDAGGAVGGVVTKATEAASAAAGSVGGAVSDTFKGGIDTLKHSGNGVLDGMSYQAQGVWNTAQRAATAVGAAGTKAWNELQKANPAYLWEIAKRKGWEGIANMVGDTPQRYHNGGWVQGYAMGGEVPAILQPGEFVVNRRAAYSNADTLSSINGGGSGTNSSSFVIQKIEINAKTNLDKDSIRREIIPEIERVLKRKSQDGEFILAKTGVR